MECGENQWISDIRRQAQRLTGLTIDLIYLSRMEEEQPKLALIDFPISDVAEEMAQSFQALAKSQEKEFSLHIQPMLSCTGDEKAIRQLLSHPAGQCAEIFPRRWTAEAEAGETGRTLLLTVSNTAAQPIEQISCPTCLTAFTARTSPAAARQAATAWGCPLPGALYWPIRERSGRKVQMDGR